MNDIFTPSIAETGYVLSDYRLSRMVLSPHHWRRFNWPQTVTWRAVPFGASNLEEVPANQRGVYSFVVKPGIAGHPECSYLLYVGMVKDQFFRDRYCQYLREREAGDRSRRLHVTQMLLKWDGFLWFATHRLTTRQRSFPPRMRCWLHTCRRATKTFPPWFAAT